MCCVGDGVHSHISHQHSSTSPNDAHGGGATWGQVYSDNIPQSQHQQLQPSLNQHTVAQCSPNVSSALLDSPHVILSASVSDDGDSNGSVANSFSRLHQHHHHPHHHHHHATLQQNMQAQQHPANQQSQQQTQQQQQQQHAQQPQNQQNAPTYKWMQAPEIFRWHCERASTRHGLAYRTVPFCMQSLTVHHTTL
uniref:Homeobox domain-containing protein n=1 Tax=Anopheles quadriannulatus TaxID=34691 RepID=A0A182WUB4_ANOQN